MNKKQSQSQNLQQNLQAKPPVVVVLGHVDHGKSSIIEAIKDLKITEKESGGITQHIGAYEIEHQSKKITIIDTPGHEAFSAMRSRGAQTADIAVLVIAAEEGIKPQTKEAISFAKTAGIPIIVALNKMDLPQADPERVKTELSKEDIIVESRGGKIPSVEVSARTGAGIPDILEIILLIAEMENFQADASKPGEGVIIEANLNSKRGPTATLLLRDGSLKPGDIVGTGTTMGRIKILQDFQGKIIDKAEPSQPVIVIGFEKVPQIGQKFKIHPNIETAEQYIEKKERKASEPQIVIKTDSQKILNLILKADVSGTLEAIEKVLKALPQDKVIVRILKKEVGEINENDVKLAQSSKAKILGFRQKANSTAQTLARDRGVKIKTYDVIYELSQGVREFMEKALSTEVIREDMGKLKVLLVFLSEKNRQIIGGKIIEGRIEKGGKIEVWRDDEKIGKGKMINLQKNKKNIEKAGKGEEVGILYEGTVKIEQDDELKIYTEKMVKETL
ncbi:translation initiation factor IF-2 [Candidatus Parcubacteria bacterium]|jgi:translation initiation factor IF-2|nr:translation initiation factor IF-2 [Candidatus Parcubacteria bacterium]